MKQIIEFQWLLTHLLGGGFALFLCLILRNTLILSKQPEHGGDILHIFYSLLLFVCIEVVVSIRQTDATLGDGRDCVFRILLVGAGVHGEKYPNSVLLVQGSDGGDRIRLEDIIKEMELNMRGIKKLER